MRNLKKFENFDGFAADEESDQMNNDQIYADRDAQNAQDAQSFGGQESQEEEGLELDEVVDRLLAAIEECGEDCEEEELRNKVKAVLTDFQHAQESQEEEDDNYDNYENDEDDEDDSDYISGYDDESRVEDEEQYERRSLKRFNNFTTNYRMLSEGNVSTLNPELEKEFWKDLKAKYDLDDSMATMSSTGIRNGITLKPKDYKAWADKYTKGKQLRGSENLVDTKAKQMAKYINKKYGNA